MNIIQVMLDAVVASMKVVRQKQGGQVGAVEVKRDKTLLTATDKENETYQHAKQAKIIDIRPLNALE